MWQGFVRNWLIGAAREQLQRNAAAAAAQQHPESSGQESAQPAQEPDAAPAAEPAENPKRVYHVGLVFALGIEAGGLVDLLRGVVRTTAYQFVAHEGGLAGRRLIVAESGAGAAAAAHATRALVRGHQPNWIVSAGFAGGLSESLRQNDIVMADSIVDPDGHHLAIDVKLSPEALRDQPRLHVGRLLSVDRIIRLPSEKRLLGERHQALAVDMESMGVAQVCREEGVRFMAVRIISDAIDRELPPDVDHLVKQKTVAGRLGAATGAIFRRPSSIKDMWQLKEDALVASDRLAKFLSGVVTQLE